MQHHPSMQGKKNMNRSIQFWTFKTCAQCPVSTSFTIGSRVVMVILNLSALTENNLVSEGPVTVIPDLRKKKIILEEEEDEAVVTTNHTHHESSNIVQEKKDERLTDSGIEETWQLKEKRSLNTVQCDKHKLQENESKRNPDIINQPGEFNDIKHDPDKDEDKQPVEESRKKESKISPLMKIEEKFRGR